MPPIRAAVFLCLFASAALVSADAQTFKLKPLSPAEVRAAKTSLDKSLLPEGAGNPQIEKNQAFHVQAAGRTVLTLIPVRFSFSEPGLVPGLSRGMNQCGVYLIDPSRKGRFDKLAYGTNELPIQCGGVEGIGLADTAGPHAQVILLFDAHTVKRDWSDPYLVAWNGNDGRYAVETLSAPAGAASSDRLTVAQVRQWLNGRK